MITIYSAPVCPFAHRTRALLTHLGVEFEVREVDLKDRDPEFLKLTPTGKVPLLVDGENRLYESRVINDYLAERHGFAGAYDGDEFRRARQRLAMLQWDDVVLRAFYKSLGSPAGLEAGVAGKVERELDETQDTVALAGGAVDNLMGFHCATHWARMDWLRHLSPLPELIDARPELRAWLDRAAGMPAVQATLPEREGLVRSYEERYPKAD